MFQLRDLIRVCVIVLPLSSTCSLLSSTISVDLSMSTSLKKESDQGLGQARG